MSQPIEHVDSKKRHGQKVRAMLVERGITMTAIAKRLGLSIFTVSCVITNGRQSRRVKRAVAEALEIAPHKLWPDDFDDAS